MDESLSKWLALREPADFAARSATLTLAVADTLPRDKPLSILDLGTGTGSNVRYLAERLPPQQRWLIVDRDPALLDEVAARMLAWGAQRGYKTATEGDRLVVRGARLECHVETRCVDLGTLDDAEIFSGRDLVTASALLDLVSETWLRALAAQCRASGAAALFALTYNGASRCEPVEPEDNTIRDLLNRHQTTSSKGFGPAVGPDAVGRAHRCFAEAGFRVRREASDWVLAPEARDIQRQLVEGWARAAEEIEPAQVPTFYSWLTRRIAHIDRNRSRITVGHEDLAAWLT